MNIFSQANIDKYESNFNSPKVVETAEKIVDAIKKVNELENDNERMASLILTYIRLNEFYSGGRNE